MDVLDLVVIGGGITGAGVARLAARNGLAVALIERDDLAAGASSASSHMLHGGLRYLEHGQLGMVREGLTERAAVLRMAGPLARPVRFLVPCYAGARVPPWKLRAGLALYDLLAGRRNLEPHGWVGAAEATALEPGLEPRGLRGVGLYTDGVMDDARLVIAVARDAASHGAAIHTYTEAAEVHPVAGAAIEVVARGRLDGTERVLCARVLVNATGPWTDATRHALLAALRAAGSRAPAAERPLLGPSRGVHLLYPALTRAHALLLLAASDGRVFFAIPFGDRTLVGTTEVATGSPPASADFEATPEEVRYLGREAARALPGVARHRPLALLSGLRPLLLSGGRVGAAPREHRVVADGPLLTVAGGKYTTFRAMARDVLRAAAPRLGAAAARPRDPEEPLPLPYEAAGSHEELAHFAVREEFARRLEDVLRRRTRLWLAADHGRAAAPAIAEAMARELGWSAERTRAELDAWETRLGREQPLLAAASAS